MSRCKFEMNRLHGEAYYAPVSPNLDTMESMKTAISDGRAAVTLKHPEDLPLSIQAAVETNTQYQIINDVNEGRSLMFAEHRRISNQEVDSDQVDEYVKSLIEAGDVVLVLSSINDKGILELDSFWKRYRELETDRAQFLDSLKV